MINRFLNSINSLLFPLHRAEGIDGSHWWGKFVAALVTKPIDFIILKATEGTSFIDSEFHNNMSAAASIPIRGAYHYQRYKLSWFAQANHFLETIKAHSPQIVALDVEKIGNELVYSVEAAANEFFSDMRRIIDYWRVQLPGTTILLYTNPDIYYNHLLPAIRRLYGNEGVSWLEDVDKWIAVYNGQGKDGYPSSKWGIPRWKFWQYAGSVKVEGYGVSGSVDLNVYNGTVEELRTYVLGTEPPPTEPPPTQPETLPETWTGQVVSWVRMKVRSYPKVDPGTETNARLTYGTQVGGRLWVGNGYLWMRLENSQDVAEWVAVRQYPSGSKYIRLDPRPTAPPPAEGTRVYIVWDDENPDWDYKCRTESPTWPSDTDNPPAVERFYPPADDGGPPRKEKPGDFRVNLEKPYDWEGAIVELNDGDRRKFLYLTGPKRASYNSTGWPMQAYISFSGNILEGEQAGDWFKFKTLKPSDLQHAKGMTIETHPYLVHRFTCVTWDKASKTTKHIWHTGTPRGDVQFFLVTKEGYAYIPMRHVKGFTAMFTEFAKSVPLFHWKLWITNRKAITIMIIKRFPFVAVRYDNFDT